MRTRRWLAILIVLATAWLTGLAEKVLAQEIKPAPVNCPPRDGYEWMPTNKPVERVLWVQVRTEQDFVRMCGTTNATACMVRFEGIGIVVGRSPAWAYSESMRVHEDCHATHDHTPQSFGSLLR